MARRSRSSPGEEFVVLLARLPWWVCLVLGLVGYFWLHALAAPVAVPANLKAGRPARS